MKKDSQEPVKGNAPYYPNSGKVAKLNAGHLGSMCVWGAEFFVVPVGEVDVELINNIGFFNLESMKNVEIVTVNSNLRSRKKLPIQIWYGKCIVSTFFPGREVPHYFSLKKVGSTISFTMTLSSHLFFRGMNLCLVYTLPSDIDLFPIPLHVEISIKSSGKKTIYAPMCYGIPETGGAMVWLSHWVDRNLFKEGDEVQVRFEIDGDGQIKECGVHLTYFEEVGEKNHYWNTLRKSWDSYAFEFIPWAGVQIPNTQNLSVPNPNSREEEDSEHLQLQVHQYSDGTISISKDSNCGSTSGTAPEGGVLTIKLGEVVTQGHKLSPEDKESLMRVTDELSHPSEKEVLENLLEAEELEESSLYPRELKELNCYPMEGPPTISHHFSILCVLDLSYTEINSLPKSISRLVALQKLFLRNCELLMELPPEIGELTNLEVLDLQGTEILYLPKEIAKLVNLTCLKVSFYGYANQTVIPRKVLSNLSRLIELIIDVTPYGEWWDAEVEAIIDDLSSLKELRTLKLYLPTAELLEELSLIFPSLANFRFTVGCHEEHFIFRLPQNVEEEFNSREKLEKGLKFINGNHIPNEITKVLKHANAFVLQRHWTAESLSDFGHEKMNEVKFCLVMECNEFRTVIDSEQYHQRKDGRSESEDFLDFDGTTIFGSLQKMIIRYMKSMVSIWKGPVETGSLSNLKSLALHTCMPLFNYPFHN